MAAGLGLKTFVTGDVLTAADTNGYLMQGVWVFASSAARSSAVTSPQEGNFSFLKDTNSTEYYDGSAWVAVAGSTTNPTIYVKRSANQTVTANTWTIIAFNSEVYDTDGAFDTSTYKFTPTVAGYYQVNLGASSSGNTTVQICRNANTIGNYLAQSATTAASSGNGVSQIVYLNGTTDYITGLVVSTDVTVYADVYVTYMTISLIRKA